jgi:uncharacterized protein (TIGR01244 family)
VMTAVLLAAVIAAGSPACAQPPAGEVPSNGEVGPDVTCYRPLTRQIATGGLVKGDGINTLHTLGFAVILDLRDPAEGIEPERQAAAAAGLRYINLPFAKDVPDEPLLEAFARIIEDKANYPLLVHCVSANRVGVMWTLYQMRRGVPFATAVSEGRAIGMKPAREHWVRKHLGQPGCTEACPP